MKVSIVLLDRRPRRRLGPMRRLATAALLSGLVPGLAQADEPVVTANGLRFQSGGPLTVDGGLVLALPTALGPGLSMIAAGDLDEADSPRLRRYRPWFESKIPDPATGDWSAWERLLADDTPDPKAGPASALRFATPEGFSTVSSALIALPGPGRKGAKPVFRFAAYHPQATPWHDVSGRDVSGRDVLA